MNKFNLQRLNKFDVKIGDVIGQGHIPLVLPGGRAIGFSNPPEWAENDKFIDDRDEDFVEKDVAALIAIRSVIPLARVAKTVNDVRSDMRLTDVGRRERIAPVAGEAIADISRQYVALTNRRQQVSQLEQDIYIKPLQVRDGDIATLFADQEIRNLYRAANDSDRLAMFSQFSNDEKFISAMRRSPLPLNERDADLTKTAWNNIIAKREPQRIADFQLASDYLEWGTHVVTNTASMIRELSGFTDRFDIYRHARDAGGVDVFGFDPAMKAQCEHKLQMITANEKVAA